MHIKLTRDKVFVIGLVIIMTFLFLNRSRFLIGSKTVVGQVVSYHGKGFLKYNTVVEFKVDTSFYQVTILKDLQVLIGDSVEMIYNPSDPDGAVVNSFTGIWTYPILFCLIPFMFWVSAAYSFITKKEILEIDLAKKQMDSFGKESFKIIELRKTLK